MNSAPPQAVCFALLCKIQLMALDTKVQDDCPASGQTKSWNLRAQREHVPWTSPPTYTEAESLSIPEIACGKLTKAVLWVWGWALWKSEGTHNLSLSPNFITSLKEKLVRQHSDYKTHSIQAHSWQCTPLLADGEKLLPVKVMPNVG